MDVPASPPTKRSLSASVLVVMAALTLLFACAFLAPQRLLDFLNWGPQVWTRADVEQVLGVAIPEGVSDLSLQGTPNEDGFLYMRFRAQPGVMTAFTVSLCGGVIHDNYDPFNAVDRQEQMPGGVQLTMGAVSYYSYAPGIIGPLAGHRCWDEGGAGQVEFVVDQRNPRWHILTLEQRPNCYKCSLPVADSER